MLKDAKKSQAIAQNDVKKREARVKKAEKAYEDKVSFLSPIGLDDSELML